MSVPQGARGENLTTVFTLASNLLALCIHTVMNNSHFPHKFTRELGEPLVASARRVMLSVYRANVITCIDDRKRHIHEALEAMTDLQAELHLNFLNFSLKTKKAGEISDLLTELRSRFIAWGKASC